MSDPRIAAVQAYLSDERAAGRCVFSLTDAQVAALLAAANAVVSDPVIRELAIRAAVREMSLFNGFLGQKTRAAIERYELMLGKAP
jgi:hypothetical protein